MAGIDLAVSGLASGFDWKAMVDQLTAVERQPQVKVRTEQADIGRRRDALGQIATRLSDLKTKAEALQSATLYKSRSGTSSDATVAGISAAAEAVTGDFSVTISSLATSAVLKSANTGVFSKVNASDLSSSSGGGPSLGSIQWGRTFTEGTLTLSLKDSTTGLVTAKSITVASSDTLSDVFARIQAQTGVEAVYSATTDRITMTPPAGSSLILGAANDTSNLLRCMRLFTPSPGQPATSTAAIGSLNTSATLAAQPLTTAVSPASGTFSINGTSISYASSDTLSTLLARITDSDAGVVATYDQSENRVLLRNREAGNEGILAEDTSGNLLEALGILDGTLQEGSDLEFSINGGGTQRSRSNSITEEDSGLKGLTFTAKQTGTAMMTSGVDTAGIQKAVNDFVGAVNNVQSLISSVTASNRDAAGKVTSGILAYDQTVFQIGSSIRAILMPQLSGPSTVVKSLEDLGFKTSGYSNEVSVGDAAKLGEVLASDLDEVKAFLATASTGLSARIVSLATPMVNDINGTIPTRQKALTEQSRRLDDQLEAMERRVLANRERLLASFRAMEAAQSKNNQQLQYLNQKLGIG